MEQRIAECEDRPRLRAPGSAIEQEPEPPPTHLDDRDDHSPNQFVLKVKPELFARLHKRVQFDRLELDNELVETPMMVMDAAEACATAAAWLEQAESDLLYHRADADLRVRESHASKGIKSSEKMVEADINLDPRVLDTRDDLIYYKWQFSEWQALWNSLKHKLKAQEIYASLLMSGYATPSSAVAARRREIRGS